MEPKTEYCTEKIELSNRLASYLDENGYSHEDIQMRISLYDKIFQTFNKLARQKEDTYRYLLVGSRGEGMVIGFESDIDFMMVDQTAVCVENIERTQDTKSSLENQNVYHLDWIDAPPGYCYLKDGEAILKLDLNDETFKNIVESVTGPAFSPTLLREYINNSQLFLRPFVQNIGPVDTDGRNDYLSSMIDALSFDAVFAYRCELPGMLAEWCEREIPHDWPSPDIVQHVTTLPVHVVRVGVKGHEKEDLQWRISFTLAEVHLIHSLNPTHLQLYVCLKTMAKHYLKPKCKNITSYVIKNIVLWIAQSQPTGNFKPEFLVERLDDGLRFLKAAVDEKKLNNYMIPDRNLLMNKITDEEAQEISETLKFLLKNSALMIEQKLTIIKDPVGRYVEHILLLVSYDSNANQLYDWATTETSFYSKRPSFFQIWWHLLTFCAIPYVKRYGIYNPMSIRVKEDKSSPSSYRLVYKDKWEHFMFLAGLIIVSMCTFICVYLCFWYTGDEL